MPQARVVESFAWQSIHLFLAADVFGSAGDQIVAQVVAPVVDALRAEQLIDGFFFVRYVDEKGPHIRWRMRCARSLTPANVDARLASAVASMPVEAPQLSRTAWEAYEPEVRRYGGSVGLKLAERVFEISSDAAISVLRSYSLDLPAKRRAMAMVAKLTIAYPFFSNISSLQRLLQFYAKDRIALYTRDAATAAALTAEVEAATARQSDRYTSAVSQCVAAMQDGEPPIPEFLALYQGLYAAKVEIEHAIRENAITISADTRICLATVAAYLVPSYMHMSSNRMGVNNIDEAFLAHGIAAALGDIHEADVLVPDEQLRSMDRQTSPLGRASA
jgi:thiopeptide-type bacteriocin biosynthesis protein